MRFDYTFGIEIEAYLPEGGSASTAAAAISERGVPCQAENYNHETRRHWKIVTDGSLGDYARGIEVVSPILSGEAGFEAIHKVMSAMEDAGCTVSRKCGLHVHVGVGDASLGFWKSLIKHYSFFEPTIDALMPASRRGSENMYARSMTSVSFAAIDRATSFQGLLGLLSRHGHEQRYYKVNLTAYHRYQTVEFRQHSGTLNATKACNWISLCLRMVDAAKTGKTLDTGTTSAAGGMINRARRSSKAHIVGELMLRPEGVTRSEAMAATGWPAISLPQQARACGLGFTTQRTGNEVRYFAQATAPVTPTQVTLDGMLTHLGCDQEIEYFRTRAANLAGSAQWAA